MCTRTNSDCCIIRCGAITLIHSAYANSNLIFSKFIRFAVFTKSNTDSCSCFILSRSIRGPADAWRASPRQGTGGEGQGDDAGQGWGAVVDG